MKTIVLAFAILASTAQAAPKKFTVRAHVTHREEPDAPYYAIHEAAAPYCKAPKFPVLVSEIRTVSVDRLGNKFIEADFECVTAF